MRPQPISVLTIACPFCSVQRIEHITGRVLKVECPFCQAQGTVTLKRNVIDEKTYVEMSWEVPEENTLELSREQAVKDQLCLFPERGAAV
jgi:hypothetical protein